HIAWDANSKTEIVVPIFKDDKIIGVLDIDAPITDRFDENDKEHLEAIVKIIEKQLA
ncbi:GAF domain-containing protein, partial [Staphylococcus aureus]|uniref:GAF domain-containing protein n=1 Tax=Staphylococcus aureus TaxID=1280 RepID=UPI001022C13D